MTDCTCAEGFLIEFGKSHEGGPDTEDRYRLPPGADHHDCEYVQRRMALISLAESWAITVFGTEPPVREGPKYEAWIQQWSLEFHFEMERLVRIYDVRRRKNIDGR